MPRVLRGVVVGLVPLGLAVVLLGAGSIASGPYLAASTNRTTAACYSAAAARGEGSRTVAFGDALCGVIDTVGQGLTDQMINSTAVQAQSVSSPVYPLKVSSNGRYLVDQNNTPFLMVGDAPQAVINDISLDEADQFFANRQKYGFNTMWINLLCNDKTGCNQDGTTYDGIQPFTTPGDLATPNEAYFAKVDRVIQLAGKYGMTVLLDPIETSGWMGVMHANGPDKAYNFGRYLGQRYAAFPNIVWMSGNDFQSWRDPDDDLLAQAVARGIQAADPVHIQTVELDYFVSASMDDPNWASFVQLDATYTYRPTYAKLLGEYSRSQPMPIFMVEANYEFEHDYTGPQTLRRQEYWSLLSGAAAGQVYGNKYTWQFIQGWKSHLDTVGSVEMTYVTALFGARPWYKLVPDQSHSLLVNGYGTYSDSGTPNDSDYATAASTPDGTLAIVYAPTSRTLTIDLTKLAGPVQARWYDPTTGTYSPASPGSLAPTAVQQFQMPGNNKGGDTDWVLVLEVTPS